MVEDNLRLVALRITFYRPGLTACSLSLQCNACKPRILLRLGLDECYGVGEVTIHLFNGLRVDVAAEKQV